MASGKKIACVGDTSTHGGVLISSNQDGSLRAGGVEVCVAGCLHLCPIPFHGLTPVTAVITKTFHNGKLIVTEDAVAGCGALIIPSNRRVYVE